MSGERGGYTAVVIELPDGDGVVVMRKVQVAEGDSLAFLQRITGGYIEHLYSQDGKIDFWMNEEGKLAGLPVNAVASELLYQLHPAFRGHDFLVGNVVLTSNTPSGDTASIPAGFWEQLQAMEWSRMADVVFHEMKAETSDRS